MPGVVDFSTGSVGIGATATLWSAIAQRYVAGHFDVPQGGRHVALVGDAELDEGAIWEALVDPMVARLGEVLWIVDLNRQSLDRVVPDMAAGRLRGMFEAAGWETITVKYGRRLRELFARDGGEALRERIDSMSNEEYQRLLRSPAGELRERLPGDGAGRREIERLAAELDDAEVTAAIADLGGHDLADLLDAFRRADEIRDRPAVIFAYTIKARGLPTQGHPANHSALMSAEQWAQLAGQLGADVADPWAAFPAGAPEAELCRRAAERLRRAAAAGRGAARRCRATWGACTRAPPRPSRPSGASSSTSRAPIPRSPQRVVTVSPDVASSTSLGGWINHAGVWSMGERIDWFADDPQTLMRWRESSHGQHIELGIAEGNLVGLLGELGATWSRAGLPLLPIGALYDPFVNRALEPWSFGIYAGGQSILVGTPSGVTLAPEGGAHQSIITPSVGPRAAALRRLGARLRPGPRVDAARARSPPSATASARRPTSASARARSTRRWRASRATRRRASAGARQVLAGGYRPARGRARARRHARRHGRGAARRARRRRRALGRAASRSTSCASPPPTSSSARCRRGRAWRGGDHAILDVLFPPDRRAPIVTVLDGHPHTLAFLSAVRGMPIANLGVHDFGQSGDVQDLYAHFGIDAETIIGAALDLTDGRG